MATPWKAIFTSVPLWAAVIANVSNELAIVIFMTEIPMYLSTALHFGVQNTTLVQWNWVFCIVAAFQVICGLIFVAFGSAELQSWGKSDSYSSSETGKPKLNSSEDIVVSKIRTFVSLLPASGTKAETK